MLALTREELAPTDTTDPAIEAIVSAGISEILVLGRRGPVQAAWTSTELQEMGSQGADILVDQPSSTSIRSARPSLADASNIVQRNVELLREFATREPRKVPVNSPPLLRFPGGDSWRGARRSRRGSTQPARGR
jgi:ferredoxin--NADP+ reductase